MSCCPGLTEEVGVDSGLTVMVKSTRIVAMFQEKTCFLQIHSTSVLTLVSLAIPLGLLSLDEQERKRDLSSLKATSYAI